MTEIDLKKKTIHFFHFNPTQQFIVDTDEYCEYSGQKYPYTIRYYTISGNISKRGKEALRELVYNISIEDPNYNQMLFYTELNQSFLYSMFVRSDQDEFINLLKFLKDYISGATVFVNVNHVSISNDMLRDNGIVVKKFLHIIMKDYIVSKKTIMIENDFELKNFTLSPNNKLVCQDWFIYFSDVAFGCIKNRILQFSGTCYLNAVVNGIILTSTARKMVLSKMKKLKKDEYDKPLDLDICTKKDKNYIFRLIYNMICSKVSLKRTKAYAQDIILEYSKLYTDDPQGQGGFTVDALEELIEMIDPEYVTIDYPVLEGSTGNFLIVYTPSDKKIDDMVIHNKQKFILQFAIISFGTKTGKTGHAMTGIICDGQYIIYDSNEVMLNIHWPTLSTDIEVRNTFNKYAKRQYGYEDTYYYIIPVYIRKSAIDKYINVSSEELCSQLN